VHHDRHRADERRAAARGEQQDADRDGARDREGERDPREIVRSLADELLVQDEEQERHDEEDRELLHEDHERERRHEGDAARETDGPLHEVEEEPDGRHHAQRDEAVREREPRQPHEQRREADQDRDEERLHLAEVSPREDVVHDAQEEVRGEREELERVDRRAEESGPERRDDDEPDARRRRVDPVLRRRVPLVEERGERGEAALADALHVAEVVPVVGVRRADRGLHRPLEDPGEEHDRQREEDRAEDARGPCRRGVHRADPRIGARADWTRN
jgi:hypothetical protein